MIPSKTSLGLTPRLVAEALGLALPISGASPDEAFSNVTTDSRKVSPGCLFVAIPGEKFDGHDFVSSALNAGARGVIVRKDFALSAPSGVFVFPVRDTIEAYRRLAAAWRARFQAPIIAVAGSVGKTTTKELLASVLQGRYPHVLKTQGSQNGFVGIPMTLLELRATHGAAVVEVGIDEIGAMIQHMEIVRPDLALLTAIGPEHLEKLQDIPTVAREEGIALDFTLKNGGAIAVNLDDPWIHPLASKPGKKIGFSLPSDPSPSLPPDSLVAQIRAVTGTKNERLEVSGQGWKNETFPLPLPGRHNARNLLAAIAVAKLLNFTPEEIRKGLATFIPAEGRSQLRELPGSLTVLCDYYNASPASMEAGFRVLSDLGAKATGSTRRWAILGDMLELGAGEEQFHRELSSSLLSLGIERVLLYGPRMAWLSDELRKKGYAGDVAHFASHEELSRKLLSDLQPGDRLLIKGSRGMKMEEVWKKLEAHARASNAQSGTQIG